MHSISSSCHSQKQMSNFSCYSANLSGDSLTPSAWRPITLGEGHVRNVNIIAAFFLLFFSLGIPWNLLVITSILKKRLYHQPAVVLLLNLVATDLLVCVLVMPISIVSGIAGEFIFGDSDGTRCKACQTGIISTLLSLMSLHTVTLMSVDRFIYLLKPLKYSSIVTPKRTAVVVVATWVLCTGIATMPLFGFGEVDFALTIGTCTVLIISERNTTAIYIIFLSCEVILVTLVLVSANAGMLVIVRRHLRSEYKIRQPYFTEDQAANFKADQSKTQIYLMRMFVALLVTNVLTVLPLAALITTALVIPFDEIPLEFVSFSYVTFIFRAVLHPVVESVLVKDIRMAVLQSCRYMCAHTMELNNWNLRTLQVLTIRLHQPRNNFL